MIIEITECDFSVDEIIAKMRSPETGCIVTFVGTVRSTSLKSEDKGTVEKLEVETYKEMAEKGLSKLVEQAKTEFEINDVSIIHRIGELKVGDNIVCIAVSAGHRKDAFNACEWTINELKKSVPIWKHEIFEGATIKE